MLYIFSQIFLCLGLGALGVSFYLKNYKFRTVCNIVAAIFMGSGYFCLGAYTAVGLNVLGLIAYICFYIFKTKNKENPLYFIIILWVITVINGIFTFSGWVSLLPTIASVLFYFSVWQKNTLVYRVLGVITTIFYVLYNVMYKSWFGAIAQSVLLMLSIIGLIMYIVEVAKRAKSNQFKQN